MAVLAVLTAVSLTLLRHSVTNRGSSSSFYAWVDLGFGVLLALLGFRALVHTPKPKPPRVESTDPRAHLGRFFGIGVAMMLTNFSTIVLYVPAMKDVAIASVGFAAKAATVAIVLAFAAAPAWVPVVWDTVAPTTAGRALGGLNSFLARHQKTVSVTVCFVFAVYLVVKGAAALCGARCPQRGDQRNRGITSSAKRRIDRTTSSWSIPPTPIQRRSRCAPASRS